MSEHFADQAAWIAALPSTDPDAAAALAHVQTCADCARALEQGRRLGALLDALTPPPPPSSAALKRAAAAIDREVRRERRARSPVYPAVAVAGAWVLEIAIAKHRDGAGESVIESALALVTAVVVALLSGVRARTATAAGVLGACALVGIAVTAPGLAPAIGVKCTVLELIGAAIPFATAAWLARRGQVPLGAWRGAGLASAGALAAHAGLHLTCRVAHEGPHLVVFHLGGVVLAAVAGLGAGRVVTRGAQSVG